MVDWLVLVVVEEYLKYLYLINLIEYLCFVVLIRLMMMDLLMVIVLLVFQCFDLVVGRELVGMIDNWCLMMLLLLFLS
jgi:hypothetical protein